MFSLRRRFWPIFFTFSLLFFGCFTLASFGLGQSTVTFPSRGGVTYSDGGEIATKIYVNYTGATYNQGTKKIEGDGVDFYHEFATAGTPYYNEIDNGFGNDLGSGSPSFMMSTTSTGPGRDEFNIRDMQNVVGNEHFVSVWYFLPSDWRVRDTGGLNFYALADPMQREGGNWAPYVEIWIHDYGGNLEQFRVSVGGKDPNNNEVILLNKDGSEARAYDVLPRGRWFNVKWWLRRDSEPGKSFVKVWVDGHLICDQTAFPYESGPLNYVKVSGVPQLLDLSIVNDYMTTVAKVYHQGTGVLHKLWTDDLEIWDRNPTP